MDIASIIGLVVALAGLFGGFAMEGGDMTALIAPTAFMIILGGSIGAMVLSFPMSELKLIPAMLGAVFMEKKLNEVEIINTMVRFSEIARKEGLLALENEIGGVKNPMIIKGVRLIIDGTESQTTKDILSWDAYLQAEVYTRGSKPFAAIGGYSPTMGVIGTVMGLINVLGKGLENPEELTHGIGVAFIATLYGVIFANLLWLPFEAKIKARGAKLRLVNEIIIEGILSIQAGDHPDTVREKMNLAHFEKEAGKKAPAPAKGGEAAE